MWSNLVIGKLIGPPAPLVLDDCWVPGCLLGCLVAGSSGLPLNLFCGHHVFCILSYVYWAHNYFFGLNLLVYIVLVYHWFYIEATAE